MARGAEANILLRAKVRGQGRGMDAPSRASLGIAKPSQENDRNGVQPATERSRAAESDAAESRTTSTNA
eukprot:4073822-Pyramimonas_sp.AAC.1